MIEGILTHVILPSIKEDATREFLETVKWIEDNHNIAYDKDFKLIGNSHGASKSRIYYLDSSLEAMRVDIFEIFMTTEAFTRYKLGKDIVEEKYNLTKYWKSTIFKIEDYLHR